MKRHIILLLIILFQFTYKADAQNYSEDLFKVLHSFSKAEEYSFQTSTVVSDKTDGDQKMTTSVKSSKYGQYVKSDFFTLLVNKDLTIAIDEEFKEIKLSKTENFEINKDETVSLEEFRNLMNPDTRYKFIEKKGSIVTYDIYIDGAIDKIRIEIDQSLNFFKRIRFYPSNNGTGNYNYYVDYLNYNSKPNFTEADFSESKIVKLNSKGEYILTSAYKGYSLTVDKF